MIGWGDGALVASHDHPRLVGARTDGDGLSDYQPPAAGPDLMLGLSGHYGWIGEPPIVTVALNDWFGATLEEDPTAWQQGNPGWWLDHTSASPTFAS